jgi:hypothetical protein
MDACTFVANLTQEIVNDRYSEEDKRARKAAQDSDKERNSYRIA